MSAISLRLPQDLDDKLTEEAGLVGQSRSVLAREAIAEYLARKERERFMAELTQEMRTAYADPRVRSEALEIAEEGVDDGLDALIAQELAAGIDPADKWWK